jgi:hypothetical protein
MSTQTIEDIVADILKHLPEEDKAFFRRMPQDGKQLFDQMALSSFGTWIRNKYGLWHDHPLTERWRKEGPSDLRDGIDYSPDHPDSISAIIIDRVLEELRILT